MDRYIAGNLFTGLSFAILTCNSVLAIHRSNGDTWSVAFVVSAYFALLLLFWFMRLHERAAPNSVRKGELKAGIWSLSTFLTCMFSYKVAALMPWPVVVVVWAMAASVIIGGFYAFFILNDH